MQTSTSSLPRQALGHTYDATMSLVSALGFYLRLAVTVLAAMGAMSLFLLLQGGTLDAGHVPAILKVGGAIGLFLACLQGLFGGRVVSLSIRDEMHRNSSR